MENKLFTACPECGGNEFYLNEGLTWRCEVKDGVMECYKPSSEIDVIVCNKCDYEFPSSELGDMQINFN